MKVYNVNDFTALIAIDWADIKYVYVDTLAIQLHTSGRVVRYALDTPRWIKTIFTCPIKFYFITRRIM